MTSTDPPGRAQKGSQRQLQDYVQSDTGRIDDALIGAIPELADEAARLEWLSPLAEDRYTEYKDRDFLDRIGCPFLAGPLRDFWPKGGPVWDGLALVRGMRRPDGVLLVEAKAHAGEISTGGTKATEPSRSRIASALQWAGAVLRADGPLEAWLGSDYQSANRLAHAVWLRHNGIPAWLAFVAFSDDASHRPTSREDLERGYEEAFGRLGVDRSRMPFVGTVCIPARPVGPPG